MSKAITCGLCSYQYNLENRIPRIMRPCKHTYCSACLNNHFNQRKFVICPLDNSQFQAADIEICEVDEKKIELIKEELKKGTMKEQLHSSNESEGIHVLNWMPLQLKEYKKIVKNALQEFHKLVLYNLNRSKTFEKVSDCDKKHVKGELEIFCVSQNQMVDFIFGPKSNFTESLHAKIYLFSNQGDDKIVAPCDSLQETIKKFQKKMDFARFNQSMQKLNGKLEEMMSSLENSVNTNNIPGRQCSFPSKTLLVDVIFDYFDDNLALRNNCNRKV